MKNSSRTWALALAALVGSVVLFGCDKPEIDLSKVPKGKAPGKMGPPSAPPDGAAKTDGTKAAGGPGPAAP